MNKDKLLIVLKVALTVLLLIPLLSPPYWYYQFLRVSCLLGFAFLVYHEKTNTKSPFLYLFILGLVLFQPFEKIAFGRDVWIIIDCTFALSLVFSIILNGKRKK